jgi:2-amino-4-hydroxy-6-hydroxymethyldihydropteridine diphosphokinase
MPHKVFLGLGSNVGDRQQYLLQALAALAPQVRVLRRSSIYETAPWGFADQDNFLNMVVEAETELPPRRLLAQLKDAEKQVGRQASFRNGPREIDIDLLLYDDVQLTEPGLTIPHSRLPERAFMLVPLVEIDPHLAVPGQTQDVSGLLAALDTSGVEIFSP